MQVDKYICSAKQSIKEIATAFDLKYDESWFKLMFISKKDEILLEFIGTCPDEIYMKYGKTAISRIKKVNEFINSSDFQKCIKRYGGQVVLKNELLKEKNWYSKIKNKTLRNNMLSLHEKIKKELGDSDHLALLTKTEKKEEQEFVMKNILKHEWLHIILIKNNIYFQNIKKSYWKYDEGLVAYFDAMLDNRLAELEITARRVKTKYEKTSFKAACKFKAILKNKNTPQQRKKAILNFYQKLSKQNT
jgi:hypothetical protein